MNELIKINAQGKTTARDLYDFLELSKGQFSRWTRSNILENQFATEGEDYEGFDIYVEGNLTRDYKLSITFAKKLCMISKSERGEQARNYFIEVEKRFNEQQLKTPLIDDFERRKEIAEMIKTADNEARPYIIQLFKDYFQSRSPLVNKPEKKEKAIVKIEENNFSKYLNQNGFRMMHINKKTGISRTVLSGLYHCRRKSISTRTVERLCECLDCYSEDLFKYKQ